MIEAVSPFAQVNGKIIKKLVNVRIEHIKASKTRSE
jgi:hypothetical protein